MSYVMLANHCLMDMHIFFAPCMLRLAQVWRIGLHANASVGSGPFNRWSVYMLWCGPCGSSEEALDAPCVPGVLDSNARSSSTQQGDQGPQ